MIFEFAVWGLGVLLGVGSWIAISGVVSRIAIVMIHTRGLRAHL